MTFPSKRLLIVGGSTRAAAWSALRAGFQPVCADLFADQDTRGMAQVVPISDYPRSIPADAATLQTDAWMFTGALENHPEVVECLANQPARFGPLLGCSPASLRLVRDPFWLAEAARLPEHRVLEVRRESQPPCEGSWVQKPISGGGGRLIRAWSSNDVPQDFGEPFYFQEFAPGESMSAVFWRDPERFDFLGATRQLIGWEVAAAPDPFAYCGSVGPVNLGAEFISRLSRVVRVIADRSGLQGLFGIDFLKEEDAFSIVELNPRYPASVEVLERAREISLLRLYHSWPLEIRSVDDQKLQRSVDLGDRSHLAESLDPATSSASIIAKVVMYARKRFVATDFSEILNSADLDANTEVADIPVPGTIIHTGWPICTVICPGPSISHCLEHAQIQVERIQERLRISPEDASVLDRFRNPR